MYFNYIDNFKHLGFGMFVHFGLFSVMGKGEWAKAFRNISDEKYEMLTTKFKVKKTWAEKLVTTAKNAGCKYITLTTRHHDGFSLYDTNGLSDYDAPHSASGRDLIKEFTDECNKQGIVPFFYHTLLDWRNPDYKNDFPKYIDYLVKSLELLCKNYGKVGGFWFDGMWDKPNENWQEDRIYSTLRKYQPNAMIINNTGLSECGKVGHYEIDSVTFERGKPCYVDNSDKPRAGEMCQVVNDHWGYAKDDCNYKSIKELIENLVDCRKYGCNFLLNTGLTGNGSLCRMDKAIFNEIGVWVKSNKEFIYNAEPCKIIAENADILKGKDCYYAIMKNVPMSADINVQRSGQTNIVKINADIENVKWQDSGKRVKVNKNSFITVPFLYGTSHSVRVAKFNLK